MPPLRDDQVVQGLRDEVRRLRLRDKRHIHSKTTIVGGAVATGVAIPRLWIALHDGGDSAQEGRIVGVHGMVEAGSCTVTLTRSDQDAVPEGPLQFATVDLTTNPTRMNFPLTGLEAESGVYEVRDGDWIKLAVTAASGCSGLSLSVNYIGIPGAI